ncbi:hypothetical protein NQ317_018219 [Molorchus minor]|uniref:Methylated-DNA--protein-cysteine methyltransferase n=1 Tax=Molorchus minor TaxID=1323400 RepID=A0ABQ9K6P3_9CUCU|nr:hypothetical protein NQ317_018219 [Molorchus minor]
MSEDKHILKITLEEYKRMKDFQLTYGTAECKFGKCFVALHEDRICFLKFFTDATSPKLEDLRRTFPGVQLTKNDKLIQEKAKCIFEENNLKILLKGTEFQMKVWEELLNIKKGSTCSYEDVARAVGNAKAVRAAANAIANNNVSYLIPCHRVISKDGSLNKYGGGVERKLQLLKYEHAL